MKLQSNNSILPCNVMFIGLSNKPLKEPLDKTTKSGKLICKMEEASILMRAYKTNLVKLAPLDELGKLRYPTKEEIKLSIPLLLDEIMKIKPQVIVLLGAKVQGAFDMYMKKDCNIIYLYITHPSYISVYKRKEEDNYILSTTKSIDAALSST